MFENTLLETRMRRGIISIGWVVEAVLVAVLVLIPLLRVQNLPLALPGEVIVAPPPPAGAPRPPRVSSTPRVTPRQLMLAPTFIPKVIVPLADKLEAALQAPALSAVDAVPWGDPNNALAGFNTRTLPPQSPAPEPAVQRVRVGGQV